MSDDLRQAVEYAARWTRTALEFARSDPDAHPGLSGHLTAASVQHDATERLLDHAALDGEPRRLPDPKTRASAAEPQSSKAAA